MTPPTPYGWPFAVTLPDGSTVTAYSSKPPAWMARRAHLLRLFNVRNDESDGMTEHDWREHQDYRADEAQRQDDDWRN